MKKKIQLNEKAYEKYPVLYMVVTNLLGLHDTVYTMKRSKKYSDSQMWVGASGDECFCADDGKCMGWNVVGGDRSEYITDNLEEAKLVLISIKVYVELLKCRI